MASQKNRRNEIEKNFLRKMFGPYKDDQTVNGENVNKNSRTFSDCLTL